MATKEPNSPRHAGHSAFKSGEAHQLLHHRQGSSAIVEKSSMPMKNPNTVQVTKSSIKRQGFVEERDASPSRSE